MSPIDPFLATVVERRRQAARDGGVYAEPKSVLEWAQRYRRIEGDAFSLSNHEPLRAIYEDDHQRIVVMKPAQRGVSEWALNLTCFALEHGAKRWVPPGVKKDGLNVAYIFPVRGDLNDFSKERIEALKEESTHLATMFGSSEWDALGFKQVGKSNWYLRGGKSTSGLKSFPADMVILDEFDELDTRAVALVRRRMNASPVRRLVIISTPTLPGHGVSAAYANSDQRIYETLCPHCGAWNSYEFFRDVYVDNHPYEAADGEPLGWKNWSQGRTDMATVELRCPSCKGTIDTQARCAPGRWRAQNPEYARVHGYQIPWWPFPFVDLSEFVHSALSEDIEEVEELHRSDLGMPYGSGGGNVTEEMLRQLSAAVPPDGVPRGPWRDNTMGVDIGSRLHYRVTGIGPDGGLYVRAMGAVSDWPALDTLMIRFQIRQAVIDAEPELHDAIDFCAKWKGRARRAFYPTNATALQGNLFAVKKDTADVQVNRTMAMDDVLRAIAEAREIWPKEFTTNQEVVDHMQAPTRVKTEDKNGQARYVWVHTRPDHLFHACLVAGTLVSTEHGDVPIEQVQPGMRVWTRSGLRKVTAAGQTADDAQVWRYSFSNGAELVATPNHPIYTTERGFIPLHAMHYSDTMRAWSELSRSSTEASCFGGIQIALDVLTGSTSHLAVRIARWVSSDFIRRSGRTRTARFPQDIISTTTTGTRSTTTSRTFGAFLSSIISPHTVRRTHLARTIWIASGRWPTGGTGRPRGTGGIAITPSGRSASAPRLSGFVSRAGPRSLVSRTLAIMCHAALGLAVPPFVGGWALMTSIGTAAYVVGPSGSTNIERRRHARLLVARDSRVKPSGREPAGSAPVFNLSVDGAEEYFANGLLVHNCVYDRVARRLIPKASDFAPAVGGERPMLEAYANVVAQRVAGPGLANLPPMVPVRID